MKHFIVVGLAIIGVAAFAACGSSNDGSEGSSGTENASSGESTPADEAPSGDSSEPETAAQGSGSENAGGGEQPANEKASGTAIKLSDSQFGEVLFGGENDQAIYLFVNDGPETSKCNGDCAAAWPPVFTKGKPRAKGGVEQALLGTTERKDGKTQVTYNGHPLYYYVNEGPNEVRCSNVDSFGGLWFAVNPAGSQV